WWDIRVALSLRGFRRVYSTAQPEALRTALRRIDDAVRPHRSRQASHVQFVIESWDTPLKPVTSAVGQLWGSLRWGAEPIRGVTSNPAAELEYWYSKLVHIAQPVAEATAISRGEQSLPSLLQHEFSSRGLLDRLRPAEVGTYVKEIFDYTFTNGRLNVFETIRLNYANPTAVRARAQQWRGRLDTLNDGIEKPFNFFALVELPDSGPQREEADLGLMMIKHANAHRIETFTPDQIDEFGERAEEIVDHRA
ncbi:MAG TPA: hypothetical protein VF142_05855, partial [Longimicrobium sp.]